MSRVYIGIGSNVLPEENIVAAVAVMCAEFGELTISPVYQSTAVGFDGDDFLNLVVAFNTELDVESVVSKLRDIEEI